MKIALRIIELHGFKGVFLSLIDNKEKIGEA